MNHEWFGVCNQNCNQLICFSPQSLGPVLIYSHCCNRWDLGRSRHLRKTSRGQFVAIRVRGRMCVTGKDFVTCHFVIDNL